MTNAELLLDVIGEIDDEYITDVERRISIVRKRRKATWSSMAAVFVVAFSVLIFTITSDYIPKLGNSSSDTLLNEAEKYSTSESDNKSNSNNNGSKDESDEEHLFGEYGSISDNSNTGSGAHGMYGVAFEGYFYFEVPSDGIYRYKTNGNCEKLVDTTDGEWLDFIVNKNGLYYTNGKKAIYRIAHDSNTSTKLAGLSFAYNIINTYGENDICVLTNFDKRIIVDGITGEEKPEYLSTVPIKATDDYMIFSKGYDYNDTDMWWNYYIKRADGTDSSAMHTHASTPEGNDKFFFSIDYDDNLLYYDIETGTESILLNEKDLSYKDLYSDGEYIYLCDYHNEDSAQELKQPPMCYKIIYNEKGKPSKLELVDDNIVN